MKTEDVKILMEDVLNALPQPYTEHVIEDVFYAIELDAKWCKRYAALCDKHGKTVTNTLGGFWIGKALGKVGERTAVSKRAKIIRSYSILDADAPPPAPRKPDKATAAKLMSDYYYSNRERLPANIADHRDLIIELLMGGASPEEAFGMAVNGIS